ncbi:PepSY-associated TM helix domain-containing protein [Brackiella oedipodis]|uniref:PepSY-associated TM helix domain-containing protein n=1 Tax=Brackiella oedipodis TaxID=124225 RepID=UPI00048E8C0B|nr:PepSY-associated TM helix domain-containing protein [Brackiella oedipodis]
MKVRNDILKMSKNLHTWVGICSGILLFICFFSAALSMFQHDLSRWAAPPQQKLPSITYEQYPELIAKVHAQYPESRNDFLLSVASPEEFYAPMSWRPQGDSVFRGAFSFDNVSMLASLDQHGDLIVQKENLSRAGFLLEQLHETAGLPNIIEDHHNNGVTVMGVVAALYFLAIMSGLIVLLPTLVKDYFAIRNGKNQKRFWLDMHNVAGITSLPFHIIICVTVVSFAFHDEFFEGLEMLAKHDKTIEQKMMAGGNTMIPNPQFDAKTLLNRVSDAVGQDHIRTVRFTSLDKPQKSRIFIGFQQDDGLKRGDHTDFIFAQTYQQRPYDSLYKANESSKASAFIKSMFSLHFGNYGGDFVRWVYFVLGLVGAFLFYSGNMLWINSRLKKVKKVLLPYKEQKLSVRILENLTVGTCFGCMLGIFCGFFMVRWLYVVLPEVHSVNKILGYGYYVIFLGSVAYCFALRAEKARRHLMIACALVLLGIPLTSLLSMLMPDLALWHNSGRLLWVDVMALVSAGVFYLFYRTNQRRMALQPS